MGRVILAVLAGAVATYFWGFLYWGLLPLPYTSWKAAEDDVAAGRALLEHFSENGTYYVPSQEHDVETSEELFEAGPVAFVHMLRKDGRPMMDPTIMASGFVLYVVAAGLVVLLCRSLAAALTTSSERIRAAIIVGLLGSLVIDIGDAVWWQVPFSWKLSQAFYNFSALFLLVFVTGSIATRKSQESV